MYFHLKTGHWKVRYSGVLYSDGYCINITSWEKKNHRVDKKGNKYYVNKVADFGKLGALVFGLLSDIWDVELQSGAQTQQKWSLMGCAVRGTGSNQFFLHFFRFPTIFCRLKKNLEEMALPAPAPDTPLAHSRLPIFVYLFIIFMFCFV